MQTSENGSDTVTSETDLKSAESQGDWRDSLPEGFADAPFFKNAATPAEALSGIEGSAWWQGNSILKPGEDATDEAKAANVAKLRELYPNLMDKPDPTKDDMSDIFNQLGRPEEAGKYNTPESELFAAEEMGQLKALAHKANMTSKQFDDLISGMADARQTAVDGGEHAQKVAVEALKGEWGMTFDDRVGEVNRFIDDAPPELKDLVQSGRASAEMMQYLYAKSKLGDESSEISSQPEATGVMTPAEGAQKANDIRNRMVGMNSMNPEYPILQERLIAAMRAQA